MVHPSGIFILDGKWIMKLKNIFTINEIELGHSFFLSRALARWVKPWTTLVHIRHALVAPVHQSSVIHSSAVVHSQMCTFVCYFHRCLSRSVDRMSVPSADINIFIRKFSSKWFLRGIHTSRSRHQMVVHAKRVKRKLEFIFTLRCFWIIKSFRALRLLLPRWIISYYSRWIDCNLFRSARLLSNAMFQYNHMRSLSEEGRREGSGNGWKMHSIHMNGTRWMNWTELNWIEEGEIRKCSKCKCIKWVPFTKVSFECMHLKYQRKHVNGAHD